jgi:hypothetical protein
MKILGILFILFGVVSYVANMYSYPISFMDWVNTWGPEMALIIRGGAVFLGIVLLVLGIGFETRANASR